MLHSIKYMYSTAVYGSYNSSGICPLDLLALIIVCCQYCRIHYKTFNLFLRFDAFLCNLNPLDGSFTSGNSVAQKSCFKIGCHERSGNYHGMLERNSAEPTKLLQLNDLNLNPLENLTWFLPTSTGLLPSQRANNVAAKTAAPAVTCEATALPRRAGATATEVSGEEPPEDFGKELGEFGTSFPGSEGAGAKLGGAPNMASGSRTLSTW